MICEFCNKECKNNNSYKQHRVRCKLNPNKKEIDLTNYYNSLKFRKNSNQFIKAKKEGVEIYEVSEVTKMKMSEKAKLRTHSNETKRFLSELMKKRHEEGTAWNIGMSRWNNEMSYPEKFFVKVIENEFEDKGYTNEYNVGIYSIDFAWVHLKKAIEIDGEQHYRFEEYIERDKRKDELLKSEGWEILRIRWKDMYKDTKLWIQIAKDFIKKG